MSAAIAIFLVAGLAISAILAFYYLVFLFGRMVYNNHKPILKINLIFWAVILTTGMLYSISS